MANLIPAAAQGGIVTIPSADQDISFDPNFGGIRPIDEVDDLLTKARVWAAGNRRHGTDMYALLDAAVEVFKKLGPVP